jgi:hypothetical protein
MSTERGETALRDACQRAIEHLEKAVELPVPDLKREAAAAERETVRLRDGLIERLRAEPDGPRANGTRLALDQVNGALALVLGVEYPVGPVNRQKLTEARTALAAVLADDPTRG